MEVVALKGIVLVKHHYGIAAGAGEIIDIRAKEYLLPHLYGETVYPVSKAVQEVELASGGKQELDFAVCKVVHVLHPAAKGALERYAPDALAVFVVEADGAVGVLVKVIGFAGSVVLYGEIPSGNDNRGISFKHLDLGALEGTLVKAYGHGWKFSGKVGLDKCRGIAGALCEGLDGRSQAGT